MDWVDHDGHSCTQRGALMFDPNAGGGTVVLSPLRSIWAGLIYLSSASR